MTFAQYEREIIADRIKDKLSASKRKGKYVGGLLPLGYDADSKEMKIIVNQEEAKTVKLIFSEYVRTGSLKQVQRLLEERNIRTWKNSAEASRKVGRNRGSYLCYNDKSLQISQISSINKEEKTRDPEQ